MRTKDTFPFRRTYFDTIQMLPEGDKLTIYEAISDFALNGIEPNFDGVLAYVWNSIIKQLKSDSDKYINQCERNTQNGLKGGRPKKAGDKNPVGFKEKTPKLTDMVYVYYSEICISYPALRGKSEKRNTHIKARLEQMEKQGIEPLGTFKEIFEKMEASSFLKGDNRNGWMATFDWVISSPNNWIKVLEGNYDDRNSNYGRKNNQNLRQLQVDSFCDVNETTL